MYYIERKVVGPNDAVMFDIDDTLLYVSGRPIVPMIKLLWDAQAMGYKVVIITARPRLEPVIQWTMQQLKDNGITYDTLGFTSADTKILMKQKLGYNFVLSVGDQETDLTGSTHWLNTSNFSHS
jgi:hydroxymethylpyrimidine pyrophosphatase-like HAD family hydrolase